MHKLCTDGQCCRAKLAFPSNFGIFERFSIFQKILDLATGKNWFIRKVIEQIAKAHKEAVFVNVTVAEILFDGYNDKLVDKLCKLLPNFCRDNHIPARIGLFYGVLFNGNHICTKAMLF